MVAQLSDVAGKSFDYVVIGGGTAGLVVASHLVEDPNTSVLVLEAGEPNIDDPKILLGGGFGSTFGDPKYDWCFATVPQKYSNNRAIPWSRGKGLGGSTIMNFYAWIKPPAADINAFEELGNPGWNWESYNKVLLRAEDFTEATEEQLKEYAHTHNAEWRGKGGPLKTTVPGVSIGVNNMLFETLKKRGVPLLEDPYGGDITGCWVGSANLDRKAQWTRSYAATAYYVPNKDKANYTVLTEATGARVLFSDERSVNDLVATGVEFVYRGKTYTAHAKKEVILSAGTIKSPQILELSGIGRPEVLKKIGVPVKLELPGVGENLQDHPFCGVSFELDPKVAHKTFDVFRDPERAKEQTRLQQADQNNLHRYGITGFGYLPLQLANPTEAPTIIEEVSAYIEQQKKSGKLPPGLAEQYDIQLRVLKDGTQPDLELIAFPGFMTLQSVPENKAHLSVLIISQHPFSRGSVHAKNNDPLDQPDIDPRYFENPYDLTVFAEHVKLIRKLAETEPFKSGHVREIDPGPKAQTDEQIKEYLRNYVGTCYHAVGSLSMLPLEKNGVVDPELKVSRVGHITVKILSALVGVDLVPQVYGTKNLRVVDLSVVPLEVAAHTQATAYAVGERAADIIKGAQK
ncbi:hypothetical protein AcW1_008132 [Taiwanofungus camphoratus]|nr:hypothetical protein AcW1_008132 [Antrodia cinnamomea]